MTNSNTGTLRQAWIRANATYFRAAEDFAALSADARSNPSFRRVLSDLAADAERARVAFVRARRVR